jgi:hypothetical protein
MGRSRTGLVSVIVACSLAGAAAGTAEAGAMSVKTAIKAQDKVVKSSPAFQSLKQIKVNTAAQVTVLIRKDRALEKKLNHAAAVVSAASATGSRQKQGQKDWVNGVRDIAQGLGTLNVALEDAIHGRATAAKTAELKAENKVEAGDALGTRGDKLLGISPNG